MSEHVPPMMSEEIAATFAAQAAAHPPQAQQAPVKPMTVMTAKVTEKVIEPRPGMKIVLEKPSKALNFRIARLLGNQSTNNMLDLFVRGLFWVKSVNGTPAGVEKFTNLDLFQGLAEILGDDVVDMVLQEGVLSANSAEPTELSELAALKNS